MAPMPNEHKALEQDASREAQVERERADFGLEPGTAGDDVLGIGGLSLVDRQEPESIFESQFADIAAIMEGILAKKKSKQTSQSSTYDTALPGGRQNGVTSKTGLASIGGNSSLANSPWNPAGEGPPSTTNPAVNPTQHLGAPAQATPLVQGQTPHGSVHSSPSGTAVNGGIKGQEATNEDASPVPTGQSWW